LKYAVWKNWYRVVNDISVKLIDESLSFEFVQLLNLHVIFEKVRRNRRKVGIGDHTERSDSKEQRAWRQNSRWSLKLWRISRGGMLPIGVSQNILQWQSVGVELSLSWETNRIERSLKRERDVSESANVDGLVDICLKIRKATLGRPWTYIKRMSSGTSQGTVVMFGVMQFSVVKR
jgi:hypothetical protein